jgi:hypothetical protein
MSHNVRDFMLAVVDTEQLMLQTSASVSRTTLRTNVHNGCTNICTVVYECAVYIRMHC